MTEVKIQAKEGFAPLYESEHAAGMDLKADISDTVILRPGTLKVIPTGIRVEVPIGFEAQVRSRSGLAAREGLSVLNSPGTIDADYRGIVKVILCNHSQQTRYINPGSRIAQLVVAPVTRVVWQAVENLTESVRGEGGLGSTDVKPEAAPVVAHNTVAEAPVEEPHVEEVLQVPGTEKEQGSKAVDETVSVDKDEKGEELKKSKK